MTRLSAAVLLIALGLAPAVARAATPTPLPHASAKAAAKPKAAAPIDVTKVQPKALLPKRKEHTEYVVEVNKLGQVAKVRSEKGNGDVTFNAQTYGNALQAFIRTPDGRAIAGVYRLTYDYDPKTARVRRDVALLYPGGVNPNAKGAALDLMSKAHLHTPRPAPIAASPDPQSTVNAQRLPDLNSVIHPTPPPN